MDRGRHRAILSVLGLGGVGLLVVTGRLVAQTPTPAAAATATPWVQASPPPTPFPAKSATVTGLVGKEGQLPNPAPSVSPSASPSREEIARAMKRKREEELARQAPVTPVKPPRAELPLSPDERAAYERNLGLWQAMPPDEKQAMRGLAAERVREETEKAYAGLGLNLNDDQREVFALRYRQERRRLEREIQEKAAAERAHRLPEIMDRLRHEFPPTPPAK